MKNLLKECFELGRVSAGDYPEDVREKLNDIAKTYGMSYETFDRKPENRMLRLVIEDLDRTVLTQKQIGRIYSYLGEIRHGAKPRDIDR